MPPISSVGTGSDQSNGTWTATVSLSDHVPTVVHVTGKLDGTDITDTEAVTFLPGALDHFTIDAISGQTAGTSFNPTFRAFDQYGNAKTDYTTGATLSGLADSPGCSGCDPVLDVAAPDYGTLSWANGVASPDVTAYAADATSSITITCIVRQTEVERAVRSLHEALSLEQEP